MCEQCGDDFESDESDCVWSVCYDCGGTGEIELRGDECGIFEDCASCEGTGEVCY